MGVASEVEVPWKPSIPQFPIGALTPMRSWYPSRVHALGRDLRAVCGFYLAVAPAEMKLETRVVLTF